MSLEAIVTTVDVDSNSDELEITLWRFGTIRVPFTSFPFRTRHVSEKELDSLKARMDEFSKQTNTSYEIVRSMKSRNNPDGKPNITLTARARSSPSTTSLQTRFQGLKNIRLQEAM